MRKVTLLSALALGTGMLLGTTLQAEIDVVDLWAKNCKKCHGDDGKGETRVGKKLGLKDYTDPEVQASFSDEEAIKVTMEGAVDESGKETMKPFKDKLSEEEVLALVAYVRAFKAE